MCVHCEAKNRPSPVFCKVVGEGRLELPHLAVRAPKARVSTISPLAQEIEYSMTELIFLLQ